MRSRERFLATALRLAGPIALQQLIFSSLGMVELLMLGQLGDVPVAAVSLGKQIFFLLSLFLFGVSSGSAIFTAQYWGKRDLPAIRRVLGICLGLSIGLSLLFSILAVGFPQAALRIYSRDLAVVAQGGQYLRIVGLSYVASAITVTYAAVLRSTENVRLPTLVGVSCLILNTVLSYLLIFGRLGLPALGVRGTAIATCAARWLECGILVAGTYLGRSPTAARIGQMLSFDRAFLGRFLKTVLPVVLTEVLWSLGITTYNAVYARMGTEEIAAFSIASTIEGLSVVPMIALGSACAIMVGNRIGAGEERKAFDYARRFLFIGAATAALVGTLLFFTRDPILSLYRVTATTGAYARNLLVVVACALWVKTSNYTVLIGILRSGGDTRMGFLIDVGGMWLVGVPLAVVGAFILHLPVYWVVTMAMADEVSKLAVGLRRVFSRRWIHNLARPAEG